MKIDYFLMPISKFETQLVDLTSKTDEDREALDLLEDIRSNLKNMLDNVFRHNENLDLYFSGNKDLILEALNYSNEVGWKAFKDEVKDKLMIVYNMVSPLHEKLSDPNDEIDTLEIKDESLNYKDKILINFLEIEKHFSELNIIHKNYDNESIVYGFNFELGFKVDTYKKHINYLYLKNENQTLERLKPLLLTAIQNNEKKLTYELDTTATLKSGEMVARTANTIHKLVEESIKELKGLLAFLNERISVKCDFKNNFNSLNENEIYDFFKDKLVKKGFINSTTLETWLIEAFDKKSILSESQKFVIEARKNQVYKVFAEFYYLSGKPHGKQSEYVKLLGDYFKGYKNEIIQTNWTK